MEEASLDQLDPATRRALYRRALVRPLLTVTALLGLYYLLPWDRPHDPLTVLAIAGGLLAVVGLGILQIRAILRALSRGTGRRSAGRRSSPVPPAVRRGVLPHVVREPERVHRADGQDRRHLLHRHIAPVTTSARVVVTLQMVGDRLVLGVLLQAIVGAVKLGRARRRNAPAE